TTVWSNTPAPVCGSFDFGSACGVPLRPGDRFTVVPLMEVIPHLLSHARKRSRSSSAANTPSRYAARVKGRKGCKGRKPQVSLPCAADILNTAPGRSRITYMLAGLRRSLAGVLSQICELNHSSV